jgi:hypothetical protein
VEHIISLTDVCCEVQGGNSGDGSMGGSQRIGGDTELRGGSDDSDDDAPIRLSTRLSESVQRIKIEPSMSGRHTLHRCSSTST